MGSQPCGCCQWEQSSDITIFSLSPKPMRISFKCLDFLILKESSWLKNVSRYWEGKRKNFLNHCSISRLKSSINLNWKADFSQFTPSQTKLMTRYLLSKKAKGNFQPPGSNYVSVLLEQNLSTWSGTIDSAGNACTEYRISTRIIELRENNQTVSS